jgi:hypothetical protein
MDKSKDNSFYDVNVSYFVNWCDENYLSLNTRKTKEMIFDFGIKNKISGDTVIKGNVVEKVDTYKYLGVIIDNKLNFNENTNMLCKKLRRGCTL